MSDLENMYQSPESPVVPEKLQDAGLSLTETMLRYLKEASPWLRFVGIMGIIGSILMAVGGIIGGIIVSIFGQIQEFGNTAISSPLAAFSYVLFAVLLFFPSLFTYNFGKKIKNFLISNQSEDLEAAFKNNKSFWKFSGIILIIYLSIVALGILLLIIGGIVAVGLLF